MKVLQHYYTPRGACLELFNNRAPEILMSGPAGTGKSRACLEKVHAALLKYPGAKALIVRKVRDSLATTALDTWRKFVIKEAEVAGIVNFYGGSAEEPPQYRYENGSRVNIGGMDKPTKIMSSEYDIIYVQEAIELNITDWENLTTRLRNGVMPYQQLIADTNPGAPSHWLKLRCDAGACLMLDSKHSDNPTLIDDHGMITWRGREYFARLDNLTGVRRSRLRDGKWVAAEGMIYEAEWNPAKHIIDRFPIPDEWDRFWSVDFGFNHPFVLQNWAMSPEGKLILYREIYYTKRTVADHIKTILAIVNPGTSREWIEPRPRRIVCDHDAENRTQLERALMSGTTPAKKKVLEGIQAVQNRMVADGLALMRGSVVEIDFSQREAGKPTSTIEEIPNYVWDLSMGKSAREAPLKEGDDGCDAMRYEVMDRDRRGGIPVRFM